MGDRRPLSDKIRKSVDDLFQQGVVDVREVVERLENKVNAQQVGGLLTLWKRRINGTSGFNAQRHKPQSTPAVAPASASPRLLDEKLETPGSASATAEKSPAPAAPPTDAFEFGTPPSAGAASLGFGTPLVEYHVKRHGPSMAGFLGIEGDPINEDILGRKYGGGDYEIAKYQNGNRYGFPVRVKISEATYGPPKNPRVGSSQYPRLRAEGEDERAGEIRGERTRHSGSGELNETVQAFKALNDIVKENKDGGGATSSESRIVDKAIEIVTGAGRPPQGGTDLIITFYQQQEAKRAAEALDAAAKWDRDQQAEKARRDADAKDAQARHDRDMDRLKKEYEEREKRDNAQREFFKSVEQDRENRLNKALEEMQGQIGGVQSAVAEEAKKEREHQIELAKAKEETLRIERERLHAEIKMQKESNDRLYELQRTSNDQMHALQMKASGAGEDKGTEMIVKVIQDGLNKADARAHEIAEVKKLEKLIATVGPENAKLLAMQLMTSGGIDLGSILSGRGGGAQPAGGNAAPAAPAGAGHGQNGAAAPAALQGGLMNGIMQQTIDSPFFKDLLEVWGGHLRMKRPPYLFANTMAGFMLEDKRVELFYDYMAGKTWPELLAEIKAKVKPEQIGHFESPEAGPFFDAFIDIIAKRIERDYINGGIAATAPPAQTEAQAQ